jgi:1,4-alpha-glucan branching enzyme
MPATALGRKRVQFRVRAEPGSVVCVAGTFNAWDPTSKPLADKTGDGQYVGAMMLQKGRYEYKFVINGVWCLDPECPEWVANNYGSLNSVAVVD